MTRPQQFNPLSEEEQELATGYVLGDLTTEEVTRLEALLTENPALIQEIHALQTSYALMPQALDLVEAPASLQEKIVPTPAVATPSVATAPPQRRSRRSRLAWILTGLGAIATLLLLTDNLRLRSQLRLAQGGSPDQVANILRQPNSRLISLTGSDSDAAGTLLFTPGNWQEVIVSLGDLPPLPPDEVYHMWLQLENGDVIYCGEFQTGEDGSVFVRLTPLESPPEGVRATELYVTVDADEAAPDPTGERIMEGVI
ncbi:anti-sigma factor domain-containing protein [Vacuolonema iberomarrocanum]|uniref:anti-sigma factor domain-containing protein n=1 Tax=Vacuolonema iberomarrocanum TaxID=3454632 RepID=UPI001A0183E5|nr:anti-sigma factor [filamentous cyanobacterium LEGE 07170]